MINEPISLLEVSGDEVIGVAGDDSDATRHDFAREAEGLQSRSHQIGFSLGLTKLTACSIAHEKGGIAFRFPGKTDNYDARGIFLKETPHSVSSMHGATE